MPHWHGLEALLGIHTTSTVLYIRFYLDLNLTTSVELVPEWAFNISVVQNEQKVSYTTLYTAIYRLA
jgi:hypothetical protein